MEGEPLGKITPAAKMTNFFQPVSIRVVDLAKDPCPMGSLARSTKENQVATGNGNEIHRLIGWAFWTFARLNGVRAHSAPLE